MILGKPVLNSLKTILLGHHLVMKFPTDHGIGLVRGDQRVVRECDMTYLYEVEIGRFYSNGRLDIRDEVDT